MFGVVFGTPLDLKGPPNRTSSAKFLPKSALRVVWVWHEAEFVSRIVFGSLFGNILIDF